MTDLSLFALTSSPEKRILRFALSKDVQDDLSAYLLRQEQAFRDGINEEIEFDGKYRPDRGECLVIKDYDDIDKLHAAVENPLSVAEIDPFPSAFTEIRALFSGYTDNTGKKIALAQCFDKRKIISPGGLSIFHSNNVYKKVDGVGITLDSKLTLILDGNDLKFYSFHSAKQIFDLSQYYIEATDGDIAEFASLGVLKVSNLDQLISVSDNWIRRKVALVKQSGVLESTPIELIKAAAAEFGINLQIVVENGSEAIVVPTDKADLKRLLRFLDEDYYKSSLSSRSYLTNSKRLVRTK